MKEIIIKLLHSAILTNHNIGFPVNNTYNDKRMTEVQTNQITADG